jgi:hypothetical protein
MSGNIFEEVLTNASGVEERILGKNYPYYKNIKPPSEIGMSDQGSLQALGNDINGLIQYVEVLVSGNSGASRTGGPLGNKFFLPTGQKCKDTATGQEVDRYIYVNNVPQGNIPIISQGLGVNFSSFKGLIPGTMSNLNVLNPFAIMQSFLSGSVPDCQKITMETINNDNYRSSETHYVTTVDIKNMDPCSFPNRVNPLVANSVCRETFENNNDINNETYNLQLPNDPITQIYFAGLGGVAIYIIYRMMEKNK